MNAVVEAMVAYLKADAGVAALVADRVYPFEMARSEIPSMPEQMVIVRAEAGQTDTGTGPVIRPNLVLISTGEKLYQAGVVDKAVFSALKSLSRDVAAGLLLHSALPGMSTPGREATTGWPAVTRNATVIADNGI